VAIAAVSVAVCAAHATAMSSLRRRWPRRVAAAAAGWERLRAALVGRPVGEEPAGLIGQSTC